MTQTTDTLIERLTRPIIGIENRTAQEAFDIMADRITAALRSTAKEVDRLRVQMERIGWHELTATEARDIARAALTPADPAMKDQA